MSFNEFISHTLTSKREYSVKFMICLCKYNSFRLEKIVYVKSSWIIEIHLRDIKRKLN